MLWLDCGNDRWVAMPIAKDVVSPDPSPGVLRVRDLALRKSGGARSGSSASSGKVGSSELGAVRGDVSVERA